ncbi:high affinity cationic amino acid transporter 1-like [Choristoneura fumiferana]|uniref:high affinity cationic amino acid transporter 1-like n=1 Tax=Choristoneura fumiferana TaxID=7141 RepID=UPI003D15C20A
MAGKQAFWQVTRKKKFQPEQFDTSNLRRCLNRWDLTALGLGSTLGVGVYVLVGAVALKIAGPSVVLSFLIAAVASLFAGLCYAEFGSRVPRAGSAYIYTYVTVGQLAAFVIAWNMILESLFGAASVARGLSLYIDLMAGRSMSAWFASFASLDASILAPYFDFFAFGIVLVLGVLLAFGVRESAMVNNVFAIFNMIIILFIVIAGSFTADPSNWSIPESSVPPSYGVGGFFPFGVWGTLKGAAVCFYGFVGFDSISSTSEEVKEPRRSIPQAILIVLLIVFLAYASVATVVTMMVPYYQQDTVASVATAFSYVGWEWAQWVVSVGAVFGISASLFGAMFPLPRLLYAMASDGLFFHWFARVSEGRKSPVVGTLLPAAIIALLAGFLGLEQLVLMMCVGTLLSYTIVAVCVVILRYRSKATEESKGYMKQMFGCGSRTASRSTSWIANITLSLFILMCLIATLVTVHVERSLAPSLVLHAVVLVLFVVLMMQPRVDEDVPFKTPLVPLIPCLSIYINICLMVMINKQTWIRIAIWILIGIPVYLICVFCYKQLDGRNESAHTQKNGKPPVQIIIESPTPPGTITRTSNNGGNKELIVEKPVELQERVVRNVVEEEIIVQQAAVIENNEEKEANIIDLLDQVIQAEEDTYSAKEDAYGEMPMEKEDDVIVSTSPEFIPHRKSLSELSDAGSDASLGNQVLSKYDVIAQVHREDLPKVSEEDDQNENNQNEDENNKDQVQNEEDEQITAFNDSETTSQTDESGYSDTIDRTALTESVEEIKENVPYIPVPPPFDENYFKSPNFKKSYTISARPSKARSIDEEENKPRESIQSNGSQDDSNIKFGSDRQLHFMSKLNTIYQTKIADQEDEPSVIKPGRRSHSTGNVVENTDYDVNRERPPLFLELKKELLARDTTNLRTVNKEEKEVEESESEEEEVSMTREDLKSKLENIFATGGPKLLAKPRLMKSNPPTPEESYQTDTSSTESIARLPKMEKNDTLGRQRAKFGEVLNSFRLSLNKDDQV